MPGVSEQTYSVEPAKAEMNRAKDRLAKGLAATPDERINWSPSPTARTPIEEVAHAAMSIKGMQGWLAGEPFPFDSMKALDDFCRVEEKKFTTREAVLNLLEETAADYMAFLDSLSQETLDSIFQTQMGSFPMMMAITFPAEHLRGHGAQLEYIQTIYGDREMHM